MKKNIYIIVFGFLLSLASTLQTQEVKLISKPEVLNIVSEANQSIKISMEAFNEAKGDYRQTNSIFLPNISVSHTGFATTNPLMAFGSKLNQETTPHPRPHVYTSWSAPPSYSHNHRHP